ncbi:ATP-binding protein [Ramlibacter sp. MAHUQ-53]|uniref:hybrid sensor histidine kinase/response regulator n=1 Tax=unclassified Ramlibacter TaxID=2617605 RepID=UPI00363BBF0F
MRFRSPWLSLVRSLRARLLVLSLLPALVLTTVAGGYLLVQRAQDGREQLRQAGAQLARQLAAGADYGIFSGNREALQRLVASVVAEPAVVSASVHDAQGQPLALGLAPQRALDWNPAAVEPAWFGAEPRLVTRDGQLVFIQPVASPAVEVNDYAEAADSLAPRGGPRGWVVVALTTELLSQALARLGGGVVAAWLVTLAIAVVFARRLSARISQPLRELAVAVRRVGEGGRQRVRVRGTRIAVINELAEGFNRMAARIEGATRDLEDKVREATAGWREQTYAAQAADQAKTKFLAAASHDLRQPMHALSMFVAALRQESEPARRDELVERVQSSVTALAGLLDALLDISKLDGGRIQPQLQRLPVQDILDAVREQYTPLAERQGLTLTVRNSPQWTETDPVMLGRIVGNFVSNAIRYTPPGDGAGQVLVAVRPRGEGLAIEVRDNGVGIAPESQQVIFDEFVQLHNPQRDRGKGLGLGLAIVRRLAELLGHRVAVRSRPGRGSTFTVTLARVEPPADAVRLTGRAHLPGPAVDRPLEGVRVLLVEDDALVRESAGHLLRLWGCELRASAGGPGLVDALRAQGWHPQLVLSDFRLGGGTDGLDTVRALREAFGPGLPALLVSGDTEVGLGDQAARDGVVLLYKPIQPGVLHDTLATLLARAGERV